MSEYFVAFLVVVLLAGFYVVNKSLTQNNEKRIEDFKEGFSKGFEATNGTKPFEEVRETPTGSDDLSDEDLYYLEGGHLKEQEKVEYVDREDEWRD